MYKTDYIFSTDIDMAPADIIEAYTRSSPLERAFQESKQNLWMEEYQSQLPQSVACCARFTMFLHSSVLLWHLLDAYRIARTLTVPRAPW